LNKETGDRKETGRQETGDRRQEMRRQETGDGRRNSTDYCKFGIDTPKSSPPLRVGPSSKKSKQLPSLEIWNPDTACILFLFQQQQGCCYTEPHGVGSATKLTVITA